MIRQLLVRARFSLLESGSDTPHDPGQRRVRMRKSVPRGRSATPPPVVTETARGVCRPVGSPSAGQFVAGCSSVAAVRRRRLASVTSNVCMGWTRINMSNNLCFFLANGCWTGTWASNIGICGLYGRSPAYFGSMKQRGWNAGPLAVSQT